MKDSKVAPNIWRTATGWRVFIRTPDPVTGRSRMSPKRFPDDGRPEAEQLADLEDFRDAAKLAAKRARRQQRTHGPRGAAPAPTGFRHDAERYLALEAVQAMPSFKTRQREIQTWIAILGSRPRASLKTTDIDNELYRLRKRYSGSSVNKFRTALMSLYTQLDGRSASNLIKDAVLFEEADLVAYGQPYDLLERILDAIPDTRGRTFTRATLYREIWTDPIGTVAARYAVSGAYLGRICRNLNIPRPPRGPVTLDRVVPPLPAATAATPDRVPTARQDRARLEVMTFTALEAGQVKRLTPAHLNIAERWYIEPPRRKGRTRKRRTPRAVIRKAMSADAVAAFTRFVAADAWGPFRTDSLRRVFNRAQAALQQTIRTESGDPSFRLPHIRLKDLRHSLGTELWDQTGGNQAIVGQMLGHAPGSPMTMRYAFGAVPRVLRRTMDEFRGGKAGGSQS